MQDETQNFNTVFNLEDAMERVDGDRELLKEIIDIFFEDCPNQLARIKDGISTGDAKIIEEAAHSLKGASSNIGAMAVRQKAYELELMGKKAELQRAKKAIIELENEVKRLKDELKRIFG